MLQKYIEIRVRLKYRLYFCASRKSLTPPRPMSASELTLQPMCGPRQAVQVFSGRSDFSSVLSIFKNCNFLSYGNSKGFPHKTASKLYPQWKLDNFDFTLNLRLMWPLSKNGRCTLVHRYLIMIWWSKPAVGCGGSPEAKAHVDESHEESREHSLLILAKTCHWEIPNWPTSSSPHEHQ